MKTALVMGLLSVMAFSANAAVYNCKPVLEPGWENTPADFLNARIEVVGKKVSIDLKADALDVYGSCGKKIGRFTEKHSAKTPVEGTSFEKRWIYSGQEANDTVTFYTKNMEIPSTVKIYYAGSCVEGEFEFTLNCTKN